MTQIRYRWSQEDLDKIAAISELYSISELAEFFDRSESSIRTILYRHKLKHKNSDKNNFIIEMEDDDTKYCTGCETILPLTAFHNSPRARKGVYFVCRKCRSYKSKKLRLDRKAIADINSVNNLEEEKEKARREFIGANKNTIFHCNQCQTDKTVEDFALSVKFKKDGTYSIKKDCRDCQQRRKLSRTRTRGY